MGFEITTAHAIPDYKTGKPWNKVYPFRNMNVGDSFDAPIETFHRVQNAAIVWGRRNGKRFVTRRVDGVARCWRVA